ncbi:MAG: hypothetical protein AVDCRST_MAG60-2190, partial [uncultured Nocardioides sp.]
AHVLTASRPARPRHDACRRGPGRGRSHGRRAGLPGVAGRRPADPPDRDERHLGLARPPPAPRLHRRLRGGHHPDRTPGASRPARLHQPPARGVAARVRTGRGDLLLRRACPCIQGCAADGGRDAGPLARRRGVRRSGRRADRAGRGRGRRRPAAVPPQRRRTGAVASAGGPAGEHRHRRLLDRARRRRGRRRHAAARRAGERRVRDRGPGRSSLGGAGSVAVRPDPRSVPGRRVGRSRARPRPSAGARTRGGTSRSGAPSPVVAAL